MQLRRDYYNNLEVPDFVLCKANREKIGIIPCTEKTVDFNFGDMDEISFTTYYMIDGAVNPIYESIEIMKYVLVPKIGFYYIQSCDIQSEGTEHEYKEVKAVSIEGLLGQKYLENFKINTGETGSKELEYDETGNTHIHLYLTPTEKVTGKMDLFDYVLEKCPDWYVAHCDPILMEDERSHRSFSIDRQDVYSFITKDIQEAFECYVIFDTVNLDSRGRCGIYLYAQESYLNDTDIYVSYDNLLKSTNISASTDDIKTCVVLKGKDDLEIREVNFGYDRLYNFDYYNNTEFWSQKLYDEYNAWYTKTYTPGQIDSTKVYTADISSTDLANMSYLDLYKYRLQKYLEANAAYDELNNKLSSFVNDDDRKVGYGEFPVINNNGEEVGSISFETNEGVRVTRNLPSSPYSGETNFIYIVKDVDATGQSIPALKEKRNTIIEGTRYNTIISEPIPCIYLTDILKLQSQFIETVSTSRKAIMTRLDELQKGGSVNLRQRPTINTSLLEKAGWGKQEPGIATLYTVTYSDVQNTVAMNFTPIVTSRKGNLQTVLSPADLESYAHDIISQYKNSSKHTYTDSQKIKIGPTYIGTDCINVAVADAQEMHELHEQLYFEDGYWGYCDKSVVYDLNQKKERYKVKNVNTLNNAIKNELNAINEYINKYERDYRRNMEHGSLVYEVDYPYYNEALLRRDVLRSLDNIIVWQHIDPIYTIPKTVGNRVIAVDSNCSNYLTSYDSSRYKITNIGQYTNLLSKDAKSLSSQIDMAISTSVVTYPGYSIYRWFNNSDVITFYNALASAKASYESSGSISVANATVMKKYNPLYNSCFIINSSSVTITDIDVFEEYLNADYEELSALKAIFPTSRWFNTNDWRGYGYIELSETWASSIEQILSVMNDKNWGSVPSAYKEREISVADLSLVSNEDLDTEDPYNYFGNYLPAYLTQLAIEAQVAALDKQMNGYDTYPYTLNSKGSIFFEKLPSNGNTKGDTYSISNRFTYEGTTYPPGTNMTWNGSKWVITNTLKTHIKGIADNISEQSTYKAQIVNEIALDNNLSEPSRIELASFIREEELSSDNFIVTDTMTEEERSEMLQSFIEYGQKELAKICIPQLSFDANIVDLFKIPEFDVISDDFMPGKSIYVELRDDYHVKATLLNMHVNYYDPTDFTVKFSDVLKKSKGLYTDLQEAINTATDAATSVAMGSSSWTSGAAIATRINTSLEEGLLSQGAYLANDPAKSTFEISDIGIFVDTASGDYGKYDVFGEEKTVYDSIYMGGGRILFTDDGWKHVRMSLGRSKVKRISSSNNVSESEEFGVFADFCIAGYVAGSQICGGELYSDAFCVNKPTKPITYFDLDNGTFVLRSKDNGNPVFEFDGKALTIGGYATSDELDAEERARIAAIQAEQQARIAADSAEAQIRAQAVADAENKAEAEVNAAYTWVENNYTTSQALDNWKSSAGFYGTNYTKIDGGHIQTGIITANNDVSWINLTDGSFCFGGGKNPSGSNYVAWSPGGSLIIKGNIYANDGTFSGTITTAEINNGNGTFKVLKNGTLTATRGKIAGFTLSEHEIYSENVRLSDEGWLRVKRITGLFNEPLIIGSDDSYTVSIHGSLSVNKSITILNDGGLTCNGAISASSLTCSSITTNGINIPGASNLLSFDRTGSNAVAFWNSDDNVISVSSTVDKTKLNNTGTLQGKLVNTSDIRFKKIIDSDMNSSLDLIMNLQPFIYKWDNYGDDEQYHMGLGAQQLEHTLNSLGLYDYGMVYIPNDPKQTWGISYNELIAPMIKVLQIQEKRIDELEKEIERIKNA